MEPENHLFAGKSSESNLHSEVQNVHIQGSTQKKQFLSDFIFPSMSVFFVDPEGLHGGRALAILKSTFTLQTSGGVESKAGTFDFLSGLGCVFVGRSRFKPPKNGAENGG